MGYAGMIFSLWNLKRNESKTKGQIQRLQQKKLRKILLHAYNNSVYYKEAFEKAGITNKNINSVPLKEFPVINKEILMENFDKVVTDKRITQKALIEFDQNNKKDEIFNGGFHIVHSSGSTGKPRYFVYNSKAWEQMLTGITRGALWGLGIKDILKFLKNKPRVLYIAATDGRYGGAMAVSDGIQGLGIPQLFLDINTPVAKWEGIVKEFAPDIIIGYPSAIKMLAEETAGCCIKRVISCGEPLAPGLRAFLESTFKCPVINFYGASESLALGVEGNATDGMYLFDDLNIVEVIDGEMYITCLYNYTQPLIRYHISDKISLRERSPGCCFTNADVLLCRNEDVMWFMKEDKTKEFIHPLSVEGFCIDGLLDYQFIQKSKHEFQVIAEIKNTVSKIKLRKELKRNLDTVLQEKGLGNISYDIFFVKSIPPDINTGKKRLIIIEGGLL